MQNIKLFLLIILFILIGQMSFAQQDIYRWRLGFYGGTMHYYGDLNKRFFPNNPFLNHLDWEYASYGASLEKFFSPAWSGKLLYTAGSFVANDIASDKYGNVLASESNFQRALNARTDIRDLSLIFTYYLDNDKILGNRSFISPYISFGIGITDFKVFGDLYSADNQRYYYWTDNTIRNATQGSPGANIIRQDGKYETNLTDLQTEGKSYTTHVLNFPLSLGLKFRLSSRLNLNLEMTARYTFTDYLDDVSENYLTSYNSELQQIAGNPTNNSNKNRGDIDNKWNDIYTNTSLSIHYNFGSKTTSFKAPKIFASQANLTTIKTPETKADSLTKIKKTELNLLTDNVLTKKKRKSKKQKTLDKIYTSSQDSLFITNRINANVPLDTLPVKQYWFDPLSGKDSLISPPKNTQIAVNQTLIEKSEEKQDITKLLNDITYLEYQIRKKKLEEELNNLGKQKTLEINTNPTTDSILISNLYNRTLNKQQPYNLTNNPNKPIANTFDITNPKKTQIPVNQYNTLLPPYQSNAQLNALILAQRKNRADSLAAVKAKLKADSILLHRQITEVLAKDSSRINKPDSTLINLHTKMDLISQQLANQPKEVQVPVENPLNQQMLAEMQMLKNQVLDLQNQLANSQAPPLTAPTELKNWRELVKYDVFYPSGVYNLDNFQQLKVLTFVNQLKNSGQIFQYVLRGYADKVGNPQQNLELSKRRAEALRQLLITYGIPSEAIRVEAFGQNDLINPTEPNYSRRVEIMVLSRY